MGWDGCLIGLEERGGGKGRRSELGWRVRLVSSVPGACYGESVRQRMTVVVRRGVCF